jgi:hypothetical protein
MSDSDKAKKIRNYSFQNSRRLPADRMTEVNGIKIPSMPGSCYHAIICALAQNKNKFCPWDRIIESTEKFMRQYGGDAAWSKFLAKSGVKGYKQRIKDNTHTLTRTGKDCYGYRLHEKGMAIYFFKDGAVLFAGGILNSGSKGYSVDFPDGRGLQKRYRGTTMTYNEYKKFLEKGYIDISGGILDQESIRDYRTGLKDTLEEVDSPTVEKVGSNAQVCVTLSETYDQRTAERLESIGLIVENALENEIFGSIPAANLPKLQSDKDVLDVTVVGDE